MNINALKTSVDFGQFMSKVRELGKEASELLKTETNMLHIGRLQGKLTAIDEICDLLDQIEAEQDLEDSQ